MLELEKIQSKIYASFQSGFCQKYHPKIGKRRNGEKKEIIETGEKQVEYNCGRNIYIFLIWNYIILGGNIWWYGEQQQETKSKCWKFQRQKKSKRDETFPNKKAEDQNEQPNCDALCWRHESLGISRQRDHRTYNSNQKSAFVLVHFPLHVLESIFPVLELRSVFSFCGMLEIGKNRRLWCTWRSTLSEHESGSFGSLPVWKYCFLLLSWLVWFLGILQSF